MMTKIFLFLSIFCLNLAAHAHGENKLGPNKGYIRMPGAFHTEVVPKGSEQIEVYLLDVNGNNPSVKSSSVKAYLKAKKSEPANCIVKSNHYLCTFKKGTQLHHGQLMIEATREGQIGNEASYDLPLRLQESHGMGH